MANSKGEAYTLKNAVCMHEEVGGELASCRATPLLPSAAAGCSGRLFLAGTGQRAPLCCVPSLLPALSRREARRRPLAGGWLRLLRAHLPPGLPPAAGLRPAVEARRVPQRAQREPPQPPPGHQQHRHSGGPRRSLGRPCWLPAAPAASRLPTAAGVQARQACRRVAVQRRLGGSCCCALAARQSSCTRPAAAALRRSTTSMASTGTSTRWVAGARRGGEGGGVLWAWGRRLRTCEPPGQQLAGGAAFWQQGRCQQCCTAAGGMGRFCRATNAPALAGRHHQLRDQADRRAVHQPAEPGGGGVGARHAGGRGHQRPGGRLPGAGPLGRGARGAGAGWGLQPEPWPELPPNPLSSPPPAFPSSSTTSTCSAPAWTWLWTTPRVARTWS
jgi:hypothetical protein